MASSRTAREAGAGRRSRADLALLWVPTLFLASGAWLAFREYGWVAWLALLAGGYVGRAVGDLAIGTGRSVGGTGEPHGAAGHEVLVSSPPVTRGR